MKRFRKPGGEKRSAMVAPTNSYENWCGRGSTDEARAFLNL
jgi:hypothetical protein